LIGFGDPEGRWRLSWENLLIEVVGDDGLPVEDGTPGQLLVTDLFNRAMPFIRYRIGDVGAVDSGDASGAEPALMSLEGRVNDTIVLPSGRKAAGLTFYYIARGLLEEQGAPREFVIRQTAKDEFTFDIVSDTSLEPHHVRAIEEKMTLYLEPGLRLRVNPVASISRSASGKRKHFFSEISPAVKEEACLEGGPGEPPAVR
jgi:phenylacetate-CoA ligase